MAKIFPKKWVGFGNTLETRSKTMKLLSAMIGYWVGWLVWGWVAYLLTSEFYVSPEGAVFLGVGTLINYIEARS